LPRRCPFSARSPTLSFAAMAAPNGQLRAPGARAAASFLSLAPGRVRCRGDEGRNSSPKFGPSVLWSGRSAPRNEPAVPWNGQPLRGAGGLLRGIEGAFRGGDDALRGTGGPLCRGEPFSSERFARSAERAPRESGSLTTEVPNEVHPGGRMGRAPRRPEGWPGGFPRLIPFRYCLYCSAPREETMRRRRYRKGE